MAATPKPVRKEVKRVNAKLREKKSEMHPGVKMAEKHSHLKKVKKLEEKVGHKLKSSKRVKERY